MYNELVSKLSSRGANIIKVVDISQLSEQENRGYNAAILIGVVLSPQYILRQSIETIVDLNLWKRNIVLTNLQNGQLIFSLQKDTVP